MVKSAQPASPVINPGPAAGSQVFSQVREQVNRRLTRNVTAPNRIPHVIAAGRAAVPQAGLSNPLPASISEYSPAPGREPRKHMRLHVQNTPASKVDNVADAIQRYLGLSPRREPTADPLDEASVARHPQQLTQAAARWAEARYYQFAANGLERYQFQPSFRAWRGELNLNIQNEGLTDVSAPAHRSLEVGLPPGSQGLDENLVFAAQKTQSRLSEIFPAEPATVEVDENLAFAAQKTQSRLSELFPAASSPGEIDEDLVFAAQKTQSRLSEISPAASPPGEIDEDLVFAAQRTMASLREMAAAEAPAREITGVSLYSQNPYFTPAQAAQNAVGRLRQLLDHTGEVVVGSTNQTGNPAYGPSAAFRTAVARARQSMEKIGPPPVKVGAPFTTEDVLLSPNRAWATATNIGKGLEAEQLREEDLHGLARFYRPRSLDEAYYRVIRIMDEMEVGALRNQGGVLSSRA